MIREEEYKGEVVAKMRSEYNSFASCLANKSNA